jgi:hypothetical protein
MGPMSGKFAELNGKLNDAKSPDAVLELYAEYQQKGMGTGNLVLVLSKLGRFMETTPEDVVAMAEGVDVVAEAVLQMLQEKMSSVEGKHLVQVANAALRIPIEPERLQALHAAIVPAAVRCIKERKLQVSELAQLAYALSSRQLPTSPTLSYCSSIHRTYRAA